MEGTARLNIVFHIKRLSCDRESKKWQHANSVRKKVVESFCGLMSTYSEFGVEEPKQQPSTGILLSD